MYLDHGYTTETRRPARVGQARGVWMERGQIMDWETGPCRPYVKGGNIGAMRTTVTPIQQAAIETLATDPFGLGVALNTLDALVRKELARDMSGGNRLRYELTPAGRLLLPNVDVTTNQPSVALAAPALFPTTDED